MKALLLAALLFLPGVRQDEKGQPVLIITIDGWGDVWPQGKHNYLTVWPDGTVVYLAAAKRGLTAQVDDRITKATLEKLRDGIQEASKSTAKPPATSVPIDYRLSVHIEAQSWLLDMPGYDLDRPDTVAPPVYRLLCLADSIRDEHERLTKEAICR